MHFLKDIDQSLFLFLNSFHNNFWDAVMFMFTRGETWIPLYLILILLLIKKYGLKSVLLLTGIALMIAVSDQFSVLIKETVQRFRPTHEPAIQDMVHFVVTKGGDYGFFSAHASNMAALAYLTSRFFNNRAYTITIFIWVAIICYTRIYLGVHYPLDILTGLAFGTLDAYLFYRLLLYSEKKIDRARQPLITVTKLSREEYYFFLVAIGMSVLMICLVISRLQHFNFL